MGAWLAIRAALALVPRQVWIGLGLLAALIFVGWRVVAWDHGRLADEYERGRSDLAAEIEADAAKTKAQREAVTVKVETKYVDRIVKVQGVTRTILKEVPVYVSADDCPLSPGFRVLHDAAAQGQLPDPARIADAAPVPAATAASTVADNYGTCAETAARLSALQEWVKEQGAIR